MLSEENELLTRVGPGTPAGNLLRRYWQPAALVEQMPAGGAPLPVRLLGEDLVLFRDDQGRPGLLGLHCSHRGADLSYGRVEDGGLRCIYHGWLYDVEGHCLEQPGEPVGSRFQEKIHHVAYPCCEAGGMILAYMGPGAPPLVPAYEFLTASKEQLFSTKLFQDCNYLQGNEGNFDPAHNSFLHDLSLGDGAGPQLEDGAGPGPEMDVVNRRPTIETEETDYGVRIYAIREYGPDQNFIKVTNFVLPNLATVTGDRDGSTIHWHVPIDDEHHWRYHVVFRRSGVAAQRERPAITADYHLVRNLSNRYLQDRSEMTRTFSGMGHDFPAMDACAIQGPGPIQDRTQEHLGYTDRGIMVTRKVLLHAIREVQEGREAPHVVRDPAANEPFLITSRKDVVPASVDWRGYWETSPSVQPWVPDEREVAVAHVGQRGDS